MNSPSPLPRVGWIGTGVMGGSMCGHVLAKGYPVLVYSRTKAKADALVGRGATWVDSPRAVGERSDIIFTIVGFPADVREVYFGRDGLVQALGELPAPVAGAVICALLALAGVALAAPFVIVRPRAHIGLMKSALNNMTQGLCMFDGAARLILCNGRFIAMHRMRPEHARAGTPMRDLVAHRVEVGTLLGDPTPISNPA